MLLKSQVKKVAFQRLRDLSNSGMEKIVFGTFYPTTNNIRQEKEKKCWKNVGKTRNDK